MELPQFRIPILALPTSSPVELYIKREDLIDPLISGNKYWKLYYCVKQVLSRNQPATLCSAGGAYSNHIAALAAVGHQFNLPTVGIIRGEELEPIAMENPTLRFAASRGMKLIFVSREIYRDKQKLQAKIESEIESCVWIPEGGTDKKAVEGIQYMLSEETQRFDYLCSAVGTGGTLAGITRFRKEGQKVLGFSVVRDFSQRSRIEELSGSKDFDLYDASFGGYGKIPESLVEFINGFWDLYGVALDPIYTGKMMSSLFQLLEKGYFAEGSKILAFHTGGLQGITGANDFLNRKSRTLIRAKDNYNVRT